MNTLSPKAGKTRNLDEQKKADQQENVIKQKNPDEKRAPDEHAAAAHPSNEEGAAPISPVEAVAPPLPPASSPNQGRL